MSIEGLLFDLDGTLVDSERQNAEAMAIVLGFLGLKASRVDREFVVGHSWNEIHQHLQKTHYSFEMSRDTLISLCSLEKERLIESEGMRVLPGAHDVILRFSDMPKAVVTGSSRSELESSLEYLGVRELFDETITSEDVTKGKPSPEGYLLAAKMMRLKPEQCLVIEDSAAGIEAGLRAKMTVLAVTVGNFSGHDQSKAHLQIKTLEQLDVALLEQLRAMLRSS